MQMTVVRGTYSCSHNVLRCRRWSRRPAYDND